MIFFFTKLLVWQLHIDFGTRLTMGIFNIFPPCVAACKADWFETVVCLKTVECLGTPLFVKIQTEYSLASKQQVWDIYQHYIFTWQVTYMVWNKQRHLFLRRTKNILKTNISISMHFNYMSLHPFTTLTSIRATAARKWWFIVLYHHMLS